MRWLFPEVHDKKQKDSGFDEAAAEQEIEGYLSKSKEYIDAGDTEGARTEYTKAYSLLIKLSNDMQNKLSYRMNSLYEELYFVEHKNKIYKSLKNSEENAKRLNNEILEVYKNANDAYLDFLLKERELNEMINEIVRQKTEIELTKKELTDQLNEVRGLGEKLKADKMSMLKERMEDEAIITRIQQEFETMQKETGLTELKNQAAGTMGLKESVIMMVDKINGLLEKGDRENALKLYDSLSSQYKNLSPNEKQEVYGKITQLRTNI